MSQDPIGAVTRASSDSASWAELQKASNDLTPGSPGMPDGAMPSGGAFIQSARVDALQPDLSMNLQALGQQFSSGLQDGFYAKDVGRLMDKLDQSRQASSGVTFGDVTVELLNVQAKVGIADAFSKVASKLSEGLQTLVVKQG